jgi:hypothetical protein
VTRRQSVAFSLSLLLALASQGACGRCGGASAADGDGDAGPLAPDLQTDQQIADWTDRAYQAYEHAATTVAQAPSCAEAARQLGVALDGGDRAIIRRAVELSSDPRFQARAARVLQARTSRAAALGRELEIAFARCSGDPTFDPIAAEYE